MFKRIFILSGIIAFFLACAMMWFWYLPMKEAERNQLEQTEVANQSDSTVVIIQDAIVE